MAEDWELLAEVSLFALLGHDERKALARCMVVQRYQEGDVLYTRGDPGGRTLHVVRSGRVQVTLVNQVGETMVLGENTAGKLFGEISLFDGGPRTASVHAVEETEVLTLSREDLFSFLHEHPHAALDLLAVMGHRLRETNELLQKTVSRNLNEEAVEQMTFGQRVADLVASFGGSWTFIILFGSLLVVWVAANAFVIYEKPFDPYPFILLNLVLSTLAALQAPIIMMSQNRQSAKDRLRADMDYEINLKAELEIAQLHSKVDRIYETIQASNAGRTAEALALKMIE
jgi:uncharacterized membrane protein